VGRAKPKLTVLPLTPEIVGMAKSRFKQFLLKLNQVMSEHFIAGQQNMALQGRGVVIMHGCKSKRAIWGPGLPRPLKLGIIVEKKESRRP
jgi:hypothetical protein